LVLLPRGFDHPISDATRKPERKCRCRRRPHRTSKRRKKCIGASTRLPRKRPRRWLDAGPAHRGEHELDCQNCLRSEASHETNRNRSAAFFAAGLGQRRNPEESVTLGSRVHGGFGAFIPLGIKIGLDAVSRLNAKPRELSVLYYDSDTSPCVCFADGIAIATYASVGQRTLTIAPEKSPAGTAAVIVIRPHKGGAGFKYTIPMSALAPLGEMNKGFDPRARLDAPMGADSLFEVEPTP